MSDKPLIPEKQLQDLREQLEHLSGDKDRIRVVSQAADNFHFNCSQVKGLVELQHFGDAKNQTAILLYPELADPENFAELVLTEFQFEEDKQEIRDSCGL